jgi:putative FmdB family regulatory protein
MPIYAYRCSACGHAQDVLQKLSDPVLTRCPACGGETYAKQVTAAGFQLKGSGWYVTDFRNGSGAKPDAKADAKADAKPDAGKPEGGADAKPAEAAKPTAAPASAAAAPAAPAAAPPPAAGSS